MNEAEAMVAPFSCYSISTALRPGYRDNAGSPARTWFTNRIQMHYIAVMKTNVLPIRADDELLDLITKASKITRLNKSEVTRQSIRLGAAELVRRYATGKPSLVEYLADFRGLEIPKCRYRIKHRS